MKKLPPTIFFDLGNVIIPIDFSRNWDYFLPLGASREMLQRYWGLDHPFHPMFSDYEKGLLDTSALKKEFETVFLSGRKISLQEFEDGLAALLLPTPPHRIAFVDALRAQGFRCHVISNNTSLHTKYIRASFIKDFGRSLESCFDQVFLSQEVGCRKPDRAIYELALDRTGARAQDSLMIDDLEANLVGARELGIETLHIVPGQEVEEKLKAHYVL